MISNEYLRKFAAVRSTKYNRKAWLDAVAKDCGGGCNPDKDTPKKDDVEDPDKRDTGAVIGDDAADFVEKEIALTAVGMLQQWAETDDDDLDEGESLAARLLAMMVGVADANKDGELDDDEQDVVNMALEAAWDYLAAKGVEEDDIDDLLNDWDDDAAERIKDFLAGSLPDGEEAGEELDDFVFTDWAENDDPNDPDATNVKVDKVKRKKSRKSRKDDVDDEEESLSAETDDSDEDESDDDEKVTQDKAKRRKSRKDDVDDEDESDDEATEDDADDDESDESKEDDADDDELAGEKKIMQDKAKRKKSKRSRKDDADEDPDTEDDEDGDFTDPLMDATYKKELAVRGGKKVRINKRVSGKVRLSAKQKMAIRKARMKSHSASAMMKRAKSMRIAEKMDKCKGKKKSKRK